MREKKEEEEFEKMIKISNILECTRVLLKILKKLMMSGESIDYYGRNKMRLTWTT